MHQRHTLFVPFLLAIPFSVWAQGEVARPAEMTAEDLSGKLFEGSVTLTSSDGTVQVIEAGEAVTIPREWTGIWETDGYRKIWVIYSEDGSAL